MNMKTLVSISTTLITLITLIALITLNESRHETEREIMIYKNRPNKQTHTHTYTHTIEKS